MPPTAPIRHHFVCRAWLGWWWWWCCAAGSGCGGCVFAAVAAAAIVRVVVLLLRVWHRACKGGMQHRALTPRQGTEQNNRSSGEMQKGKRNMPRAGATGIVPGGVCVVGKRREDRGVLLPHKFTRIEKYTTQKANNKTSKTDTQENRARLNCGIAEQPSLKSERAHIASPHFNLLPEGQVPRTLVGGRAWRRRGRESKGTQAKPQGRHTKSAPGRSTTRRAA